MTICVMFAGFFGVMSGVYKMAMRYVGVVPSLVVVAGLMMFGGAPMMFGSALMVFGSFAMMFRGFVRHR